MQLNSGDNQTDKLRNFLVYSAIGVAVIIIVILIVGSIAGSDKPIKDLGLDSSTPTPYGTEVMTPFYTPTRVPDYTAAPSSSAAQVQSTPTQSPYTPVPSITKEPDYTPVPIDMDAIYKKGDTGSDIKLIQNMLISIGFDPGAADGDFGGSMEDAIEQFQLYIDVDDDGIAGPDTLEKLVSNFTELNPLPAADDQILKGYTIGIDAGHQKTANTDKEYISPTSTKTAIKADDGTYGRWTGVKEYTINLQVALKLKRELEALGATVIMTRQINDVDISNSARVDCWVQIYSNGDDDSSKKGMLMLLPKTGCMDTSDTTIYTKSSSLGDALLSNACAATGSKNLGTLKLESLTSFCWSKVPVCLIEIGYLTNQTEDQLLVTKSYQQKIVDGLVDGFIEYFQNN